MPTDALQLFTDYKTISDQLGSWCTIVDSRALERMPEVFDKDVEWDFGEGTIDHGLDNVIHRIKAHLVGATFCGATQHQLANPRIDIDGDRAESEAYFFASHAGLGNYEGRTLLLWGTYSDGWVRKAEGWRIVKRRYRINISDGPPEIVYANAPAEMWQEGDSRRLQH